MAPPVTQLPPIVVGAGHGQPPAPAGPRVLIVKLSSLGDVVHAMPAVFDIRQALPQAQIDWVVERAFAPLVRQVQGIGKVIPCELRKWRKDMTSPQTRAEWAAFRAELYGADDFPGYDAVIDLQGLTKSGVVAALAGLATNGKRFALANRTDGSSFEWPSRFLAHKSVRIPPHTAAVPRGRLLCAQALGYELGPEHHGNPRYGLLQPAQLARSTVKQVAFVHGTSRDDKLWPDVHWVALGKKFTALGYRVVLPHGSDSEMARAKILAAQIKGAQVWPRMPLNILSEALAGCWGVVGVDSGLSHIAVAVGLPTVQVYNFDTAWRTGPPPVPQARAGGGASVFAAPTPPVDAVWAAWLAVAP